MSPLAKFSRNQLERCNIRFFWFEGVSKWFPAADLLSHKLFLKFPVARCATLPSKKQEHDVFIQLWEKLASPFDNFRVWQLAANNLVVKVYLTLLKVTFIFNIWSYIYLKFTNWRSIHRELAFASQLICLAKLESCQTKPTLKPPKTFAHLREKLQLRNGKIGQDWPNLESCVGFKNEFLSL